MSDSLLQSAHRDSRGLAALIVVTSLLGLGCALGLAWFMSSLIRASEMNLDNSQRSQMLDFVRVKRSEAVERKDRKPDRPPVNDVPDIPDTPQQQDASNSSLLAVSMPEVSTDDLLPGRGGIGIGAGEGDYLPIVKVAPIYPQRAIARELEGDCVVQYDVTTLGTTRNVEVVEEECADRIFHKPSIEAAKRFKYKPRVLDGEAVEVFGVRNVFHYEMQKPASEDKQ
jgi:protein TonB